jgi:hypothetical protein
MTEAPTAGKFRYRHLAKVATAEVENRKRLYSGLVGAGKMTMAKADYEIEAMEEIADILHWLADEQIEAELDEDGEPGW